MAFAGSYEEESVRPLEFFAHRLAPDANVWPLGAFREKRLVGIVTLVRDGQLKARHKAALYGMYVAPASRGLGIGRLLLTDAINLAQTLQGVRQIRIGVVSANRPALRLYRSVGFVEYGKERQAWLIAGRFYDETLMAFRLPRARRGRPEVQS